METSEEAKAAAAADYPSIGDWETCAADPSYRAAVIDLLGALAYGELSAFERLAEDAKMAPTLEDKAALAGMAAAEFHHYELLHARLRQIGADPTESMQPFAEPLESFHRMTAPADWPESLVKAYVGDSIAADFYREVAVRLDDDTRELVLGVMADTGHAEFAVAKVRSAIEAQPKIAGRLALWGRRLMGEALSQAQRVVAERDALSNLLIGGVEVRGFDLVEVGKMFNRITEAHTRRMAALGLAS
ncbi:ferritin-like fold-containing protein [Streptacidiphilus monticola]|uniref:Ferritin-like fold-containing protein n=1 Tax=Streptacidiphilus monticola TaxID=2161674 RepID=A0ABW1G160_9ACTN